MITDKSYFRMITDKSYFKIILQIKVTLTLLIPGLLGAPQYRGGGADSAPPT